MNISRNIKHGSVVAWRGNKLILASKRTKRPAGVFNQESKIKGFTIAGEIFSIYIPGGIRTNGEAVVKVAK